MFLAGFHSQVFSFFDMFLICSFARDDHPMVLLSRGEKPLAQLVADYLPGVDAWTETARRVSVLPCFSV